MTRMLERLIARGLVKKIPDQQDRRAFSVSLTAKGAKLRAAIVPRTTEVLENACQGIDPLALDATVATLKQIVAQLS